MSKIVEILQWCLSKLRLPSGVVKYLGILIASCLYILHPFEKPYIAVAGNNVSFELTSFQTCTVVFKNPTRVTSYSVQRKDQSGDLKDDENVALATTSIGKDESILQIRNPYTVSASGSNLDNYYRVTVVCTGSLSSDISAVETNDTPMGLKSFFDSDLKSSRKAIVRFSYIRNDLAVILFRANDIVSNWILCFMFFFIVVLMLELINMECRANLYSDYYFKKYLIRRLRVSDMRKASDREEAVAKYRALWFSLRTRFRFLQVLGPAVGFIMTVASLIAALYPSVHASNDLDAFINGIHVAMVSTFLGLFLRIVALEGARVNDKLLERAEGQLVPAENK